jgi:hypothetical protein
MRAGGLENSVWLGTFILKWAQGIAEGHERKGIDRQKSLGRGTCRRIFSTARR